MRFWNAKFKRVGGIRFIRIGRINISWSISKVNEDHNAKLLVQSARSADFDLALRYARGDVDYVRVSSGRVDSGRDDSDYVVKSSR